jgi:hypothetical protein
LHHGVEDLGGEVAEEGPQGVVVVGKQSRRGDVLHRAGERPARTDGNALGMDADARASDLRRAPSSFS